MIRGNIKLENPERFAKSHTISKSKKNIYAEEWISWKLNTYFKDTFTLAKWLTKAGYPVELYYEEIK